MSKAQQYWIQTFSGKRFDLVKPKPESITIRDIAHSLSNICRFNGHCEFYSVAQHSVMVSQVCDPQDAFWGLMHDATEAYYNDLSSPLKNTPHLKMYKELEHTLEHIIFNKFNLLGERPNSIKRADLQMLSTEAVSLISPLHPDWDLPTPPLPMIIIPVPPKEAERLFLHRFKELAPREQYKKWMAE